MKKISKILSVFLALLMVVTIIPMSSITASAEDLETSGTCGENLTWEFDPSTGTLTISGTGAMDDYNLYDHPWEEYREDIKKVIINDGVTSIGCWAFFELPNLERATIPETVTTINDCAFDSCYALKEINIPAGVTTIGVGVFNATSLETITIPNSVTTIGDGAFFGCYSLTDVYYSGTEDEWNNISIDNTYVGNDPLLNATIHFANASNPSGACGENVTWEFDPSTGTLTISGTGAMDDYTITKTPWADYKENIKYGVIDNGVTTIGVGTFNNCTNLISATIPNSVTSIGTAAFSNCSNLSQLSIPDSVTTIGAVAFSGCERLTNITFSDSVTIIGNSAFSHCSSLTSVTIPNSVTTIGDYAFSSCERLASVTIPGSVKYIGELAFYNCTNLMDLTIPGSVNAIGSGAFAMCNSLTNVEIYSGVTTIGESVFGYCESLESIIIPDSVTTIGAYAFYECAKLTDVYYTGTENEWDNISIDNAENANDPLLNATIHYNYIDPDKFTGIDGDYFYINDVRQKAYQLVEFEGDYYFINDGHKIAKNKRIYLSERFVEGTNLKVGYYDFDAEGKMILLNGPVGDYFYKDNVRQKAYQLVEFEGNYYFINDGHKIAKNKRIYLSERFVEGTDIKVGYYEFDAEGKMVYLNGPVGDYFYKDNVRLKAYQLVEFEGDYYFINDSHKLAKNKRIYLSERFVEGTDLKVGYYEFDADGKMVYLNGPVGDYFYKDNVRLKAYQLVEFEGDYYFINDSHKLAKNKRIYLSQRFVEGTDLKVGWYNFDADGKMIIE